MKLRKILLSFVSVLSLMVYDNAFAAEPYTGKK